MARYIYKHRRGTAEQWKAAETEIPMEGEIVIEFDNENSLHKLKIGDGIHTYAELNYLQAGDDIVTQVLAEVKPRIVTVELASNWTGGTEGKYSQVIALDNLTEHSRLDLQPDADMLAEFKQLGLVFVTENNSGTITVYSVGNMPLKSYIMQATIVETECDGYDKPILGIPVGAGGLSGQIEGDYATKESVDNLSSELIRLETEHEAIRNEFATSDVVILAEAQSYTDAKDTADYYTNTTPTITALGGIPAGTTFDNMKVTDVLNKLLYPYLKPTIGSLTLSPSEGAKEYGVSLSVATAKISITKKTNNIVSVILYKGNVVIETKTDGVANGGTITFNIGETLDGTSDVTYKVEVSDGENTVSDSATYKFVYPYYYGVVANGATIDSVTVLGFTKDARDKGNRSYTYTTDNQCPVIAYPKSYGALKSIVDPNNFTQTWAQSTVTVNSVDYYVYVGSAATATAKYTFNY